MAVSAVGLGPQPTDGGYQLTYRRQKGLGATGFDDPRALLSPGMTPVDSLSYRVYGLTNTSVNVSSPDLSSSFLGGFGGGVVAGRSDVAFGSVAITSAVVAFEGADVIDLPTDGLTSKDGGYEVPENVFRVIYAGSVPLLNSPNDTIQQRVIAEWTSPSKDNKAQGVVTTPDPPDDVIRNGSSDTASKVIRTNGSVGFLSYVAMTRPIFRDVITQKINFSAAVVLDSNGSATPTDASLISSSFSKLRYAFVNVAASGEDPRFQWRLAESFGIRPSGKPVDASASVLAGLSVLQRAAEGQQHWVYDLGEKGDELSKSAPYAPAKTPYSPAVARAKMNPLAPEYDPAFKAVIVHLASGAFAPGGDEQAYSAGLGQGTSVTVSGAYTSEKVVVSMNKTGRLGLEYETALQSQLLAKTIGSTFGVAAIADYATSTIFAFDVVDSPAGSMITERVFGDDSWQKRASPFPKSLLGQYLLGESPNLSGGKPVFSPPPFKIDVAVSGASVLFPSGQYATALTLAVSGDGSATDSFAVFPDAQPGQTPVFEACLVSAVPTTVTSPMITVGVPGITYGSVVEGGGIVLDSVYGVSKDQVMLEAFSGDQASKDHTDVQFSQVKEQKFPVLANNISATINGQTGWAFVATENDNRIDLGVRTDYFLPFSQLRDVVSRIPDDDGTTTTSTGAPPTLPSAFMPFLLADTATSVLFLFYVYKTNLMVKKIPTSPMIANTMFTALRRYNVATEMDLVRSIHKLGSAMVFDVNGGSGTGIKADLKAGLVRSNNIPLAGATTTSKKKAPSQINQHSAFIDRSGYLFALIETSNKISIRKSSDLGESWTDVLPDSFSFIPADPTVTATTDAAPVDGAAPFCLYDPGQGIVCMFFFYSSCLLVTRFNVNLLRDTPDNIALFLKAQAPMAIVGPLSKLMTQRGISGAKSVQDIRQGETPAALSPHRVAAVRTIEGYYRVFYKDDKKRLKSVISNDGGSTWLTERQLIEAQIPAPKTGSA